MCVCGGGGGVHSESRGAVLELSFALKYNNLHVTFMCLICAGISDDDFLDSVSCI